MQTKHSTCHVDAPIHHVIKTVAHHFLICSQQQLIYSSKASILNSSLAFHTNIISKFQRLWIHPSRIFETHRLKSSATKRFRSQQLNGERRWFDRCWIYCSNAPDFSHFNAKKHSFISNSAFEHTVKRLSSIMNFRTPTDDADQQIVDSIISQKYEEFFL